MADAQWIETGPYTSTNSYASTPGTSNSSTLVYGMPGQGDPVYGAANAILQSPVDPNTYWVATTSGGIWKTSDGGVTWTATTDHQRALAIGAIAIDSTDPTGRTLYAGSGYYSAGAVNAAPPTTLLKSTDGGASWQVVSATGIRNLYLDTNGNQQVDVNPASIKNIVAMGNVILVAAGDADDHFSYGQAGGLYRSTDGGQNFSLVHGFDTEVTSLVSTKINNQTVLIAARNSSHFMTADGVFYSTDAGAHWTSLLDNGTTLHPTNSANPIAFGGTDNVNVKVAAGAGGSLFVAVVKDNTDQNTALYYTPHFTPGSTPTWYNLGEAQFVTPSGNCSTGCTLQGNKQGATHFALVADPVNPNVAYIAGSGVFGIAGTGGDEVASLVRVNFDTSANAATYTPLVFPTINASPHADTRSMVINAQGNLLVTDDGGVYSLTSPATSTGTWSALGGVAGDGSPIRAFETYAAVMDPKTGRFAFASQDNGAGISPVSPALSQYKPGGPWQNVLGGDGFSVAVNARTSGPSIFYLTADDTRLARVFANQTVSTSSPANLLEIDVGTTGHDYYTYEANHGDPNSSGIVTAVNAVDPTKLLFRSARLYTWTDPGTTTLSGSIEVTDISSGNLFGAAGVNTWTEKIAYGTQDAPDAILAGGVLPNGNFGVYLRTQEQVNSGQVNVGVPNRLAAYHNIGGGNPIGLLFDPATEHKFFITDAANVYATSDTGQTLSALNLPAHFSNPAGLTYIADGSGNANNGVRALVVGGVRDIGGQQGGIISTLDPFAANVQWMNLGPSLPNAVVYGLNYYSDIDTMVAALYGRGVYLLYDVTSYFDTATALWFGKANNDSAPEASRLTGNRLLEKFGTGTLTLTGAPAYSGGTVIDAGVVAITADANLGAVQGGVTFNGGVLQVNAPLTSQRNVLLNAGGAFDAEADATWSGTIAGTGALSKIGPATLTLTGTNSYLGGTFIYGGALAVGADRALGDPSGQIGLDAGTLRAIASFATARSVTFGANGGTIDVGANTLSASGLWAALGPVTKTGSGTLALQGLGSFRTVTVAAGTLRADGVFGGSALQVQPGATLSGTGQIGAPATVYGTLAPGSQAPGALTFTAPVTLAAGSNLNIAIDGPAPGPGAGTYSQLLVNGAGLTLGGTLSPLFRGIAGGNNNFTPQLGQQFIVASATGGVSGQFAGIDLGNSALPSWLRLDTVYQPTLVDLVATPASYAVAPPGLAWNVNQQQSGAALDALRPAAGSTSANAALQGAFNSLYLLSPTQLASALTGLSPESEARGVANTLGSIDAIHAALQEHLLGGSLSSGFNNVSLAFAGGGRDSYAAFNSIAKPSALPSASPSASAATSGQTIDPGQWWSSVFYRANAIDSSGGIAGGSTSVSGFIGGVEGDVRPGWLLGAAFATAHTDAAGLGSGSGDDLALVVYGRRTIGALQGSAYIGTTHDSIGLRHDFGTGAPASQTSNAGSLIAGGSIAYTVRLGGFEVTPTATAAFTRMLFDGAAWTSPQGFAFNVSRQWTDHARFTLGPVVSRDLTTDAGMKLHAVAAAGFLYQTDAATALDATIFSVPEVGVSAPVGHAGGYLDLGLNAAFTGSLTGFVHWRGEARAHAHSNQISGGLSATF